METIIEKLKKDIDLLQKSDIPKIVFVGGVPGAGKSLLIRKVLKDYENDEFSIIEPDLYRKYFMDAKTVEQTVERANKIELELLLYSIKKNKNIIHISSLRSYEYINSLIEKDIIPLGYEVFLYIIYTDEIISAISTYERYIQDKINGETFPRLNKMEYLKLANEGFFSAIEFFSRTSYFKNIKIFRRGQNLSLPIEIPIVDNSIIQTVEHERLFQRNQINPIKIQEQVEYIRRKLNSSNEIEEFNKTVFEIIYNNVDKKILKKDWRCNDASNYK